MTVTQWEQRAEMALATPQDAAVHRLAEWAQSADAAYQVATRLSDSAFVPQQFRGKPVETTAAILAGLEVGLQPMQALRSFDIISGQAAPRAITLRALVQSQGHEVILVESTETRCRMKGRRRDSQEWQTVTWTMDRARNLGLVSKDNWKKQPGAMLVARATSELCRLLASDAILGLPYSSEEIADGGSYEQQAAEEAVTPSTTGTRRMSRPKVEDIPAEPEPTDEPLLLNTSSKLAKAMYASINDLGISDNERIPFIVSVIDRSIESTKDMTEDEAREVLRHIDEINGSVEAEVIEGGAE